MTRTRTTLAGMFTVAALALTACGGSDDDEPTEVAATVAGPSEVGGGETSEPATDEASEPANGEDGSEQAPLPATVEVPADWDPLVPVDPIPGVGLTFIDIRDNGGPTPLYELQYDGTDQDGVALYDQYEALVLAAGWTEFAKSTPLIGTYTQGDRNLTIAAFGGTNSQIIVSVAPG